MEIKELINLINGTDEDGVAKSAFTLMSEAWDSVTGKKRPLGQISMHAPSIKIERHGKDTQVDMVFPTDFDANLRAVWILLEKFGSDLDIFADNSKEVPVITLTIVPVAFDGKYYAMAVNPRFWALQPDRPGEKSNCIRILFETGNIQFYSNEKMDIDDVISEAAGEQRYRDYLDEKEDEMKKEKDPVSTVEEESVSVDELIDDEKTEDDGKEGE